MEIAKNSKNDQNDQKSPKTTKTTNATKQKILRPKDSENDQFGRKRPKMATLASTVKIPKNDFFLKNEQNKTRKCYQIRN